MIRIVILSLLVMVSQPLFANNPLVLNAPHSTQQLDNYWKALNTELAKGNLHYANELPWSARLKTMDAFIKGGGRINQISLFVVGPMPDNLEGKEAAVKLVNAELSDRGMQLSEDAVAWLADTFLVGQHEYVHFFNRTSELSNEQLESLVKTSMNPAAATSEKIILVIYPKVMAGLTNNSSSSHYNRNHLKTYLSNNYQVIYREVATTYDFYECVNNVADSGCTIDAIEISGKGDHQSLCLGVVQSVISDFGRLSLDDNVMFNDAISHIKTMAANKMTVMLNGQETAKHVAGEINLATFVSRIMQKSTQYSNRTIEFYAPTTKHFDCKFSFNGSLSVEYIDPDNKSSVTFHKTLKSQRSKSLTSAQARKKKQLINQFCFTWDEKKVKKVSYQLYEQGWYDDAALKYYQINHSVRNIKGQYFSNTGNYLLILSTHLKKTYKTEHMTLYELMSLGDAYLSAGGSIESLRKYFGLIPDTPMGLKFAIKTAKKYIGDGKLSLSEAEFEWLAKQYIVGLDLRDMYIFKRTKTLTQQQLSSMISTTQRVLAGHRPAGNLVLVMHNSRDHNKAFNNNNFTYYLEAGYQICYLQVETDTQIDFWLRRFASQGLTFDGIDLGGHGYSQGIVWGSTHSLSTKNRHGNASYGETCTSDNIMLVTLIPTLAKVIPGEAFVVLTSCGTAEIKNGKKSFAALMGEVLTGVNSITKKRIDLFAATKPVNDVKLEFKNGRVNARFYHGIPMFKKRFYLGTEYTYHKVIR